MRRISCVIVLKQINAILATWQYYIYQSLVINFHVSGSTCVCAVICIHYLTYENITKLSMTGMFTCGVDAWALRSASLTRSDAGANTCCFALSFRFLRTATAVATPTNGSCAWWCCPRTKVCCRCVTVAGQLTPVSRLTVHCQYTVSPRLKHYIVVFEK